MADAIRNALGIEAELIGGGGGVFDVHVDGQLLYSKHQNDNEFPEHQFVIDGINKLGEIA